MKLSAGHLAGKPNEYEKDMSFPAGHYYSPVVDVDEAKQRQDEIWKKHTPFSIPGIDLNESGQVALIKDISPYYVEIPFRDYKNDLHRYYYKNDFFSYSDGIFLYSMIRHFNPARIIEVGSGFSSALMLDALQLLHRRNTALTFMQPHCERLISLVNEKDRQQAKII